MPELRRFEPEELLHRPGTYFNPSTEVLLVVDDSTTLAADLEDDPGGDWILISDEVPVDEHERDALLERFAAVHGDTVDEEDEEIDEEEELGELEDEY